MSITAEQALPPFYRAHILREKIRALKSCVGNERKIAQREQELAELEKLGKAVAS
jgi:hypothetical protein